MAKAGSAENVVREIRRRTRRQFSAEEKIRIVLEGVRGEESIAALCRREGLAQNLYYRWSKEFLEAGKKRLLGVVLLTRRQRLDDLHGGGSLSNNTIPPPSSTTRACSSIGGTIRSEISARSSVRWEAAETAIWLTEVASQSKPSLASFQELTEFDIASFAQSMDQLH